MGSIVPLRPVPNQTFAVPLDGQGCQIVLYQRSPGMFIDVLVDSLPIVLGVICEDRNRIIRDAYLGFRGDLAFIDTQAAPGTVGQDPDYTGLGDRYQLLYLEPGELPEGSG